MIRQERGRPGYFNDVSRMGLGMKSAVVGFGIFEIIMHLEFLACPGGLGTCFFHCLNSSGVAAGLQQIVEGLSKAESFGRRVLGHDM